MVWVYILYIACNIYVRVFFEPYRKKTIYDPMYILRISKENALSSR